MRIYSRVDDSGQGKVSVVIELTDDDTFSYRISIEEATALIKSLLDSVIEASNIDGAIDA